VTIATFQSNSAVRCEAAIMCSPRSSVSRSAPRECSALISS
jgi:hypothetical protein